jgi:hypothetical protein
VGPRCWLLDMEVCVCHLLDDYRVSLLRQWDPCLCSPLSLSFFLLLARLVIKVGEGEDPDVYPNALYKVRLNVDNKSSCLKHYKNFLGTHQFCTSDTPVGHSVCNGDSGGPVLYGEGKDQFVVGLVNHGVADIECGTKGGYQYFTYIKPYLPWVEEETKRFLRDGPRKP